MDTDQLRDWQEELLQQGDSTLLLSALITAGLSVPQSKAAREIITYNYPAKKLLQSSRFEPKQSFSQCLQEFLLVLFPDPTKPVPGMGLKKQTSPKFPLGTFVPRLSLLFSHTHFHDTVHILRTASIAVKQQWDEVLELCLC